MFAQGNAARIERAAREASLKVVFPIALLMYYNYNDKK